MGTQPAHERMCLSGLATHYRARAGAALALKALLDQAAVQTPLMDWQLEVSAPDGSFWYVEVSRSGPASKYRRAGKRAVASRAGYFVGETDCLLPGFGDTPQPCLLLQTGEQGVESRLAIRVWDIITICNLV